MMSQAMKSKRCALAGRSALMMIRFKQITVEAAGLSLHRQATSPIVHGEPRKELQLRLQLFGRGDEPMARRAAVRSINES
eukprot:6209940-Pleurochrysis_carterae.AAC.1